ncbi:MAG TPA: tetratricopeptide repeat protein [Acidobacteriaceae bacterium]|jgi:tetratricopeptide (TPR) repeat protein
MRFLTKLPVLAALSISLLAGSAPAVIAQAQSTGGRVVLVLPFENRSGNTSLNWIGDSFPDTLNKRLNSAGFLTISHDDRVYALQHLGLPADFRPSRATTIRIAQQLDANYVIIGNFTTNNDKLAIQARVLSVDELHLTPPVEDSAELTRLFDAENAIAWKVARAIDPHFNVAEATFLAAPGAVPLSAFEDYIRGIDAPSQDERIQRLKAAIAINPNYPAALLALGKEQYAARDFAAAAATLAKVPADDRVALEASFYLGLSRFNSADYAGAENAFGFVATRLPLSEVLNNQAVALSRQGKDAVAFFQRVTSSDPNDEDYHYNLAVSLFRRGDTVEALHEADAALKLKPNDNEAGSLRAHLSLVPLGTRLTDPVVGNFSPQERIRRTYSETGFRQAAFQLNQMRAAQLAVLPAAQQAAQYNQLASENLAQGLMLEAEGHFQSALAADPRNAVAHAGLARVREASGDRTNARNEAMASLQLQPNVAALLVLARLDLAENSLSAAANDVSRALTIEPTNSAALALRQNLQQRGQQVP